MKTYTLTLKNRIAVGLFILAALGIGAALLVVGFALLAGLAVGGALLATGVAIYGRVTGRRRSALPTTAQHTGLDPALEVFPQRGGEKQILRSAQDDDHSSS